MPLTNLRNVHLTEAEVYTIMDAMAILRTALQNVNAELTAEDRKKYGSINEQTKLLVNKVRDYRGSRPDLSSAKVDWAEFQLDFSSRAVCESLIEQFESFVIKLKNAKILYDYDNYRAALEDYSFTTYQAGSGADGFENKMNELKQFFNRSGETSGPPEAN